MKKFLFVLTPVIAIVVMISCSQPAEQVAPQKDQAMQDEVDSLRTVCTNSVMSISEIMNEIQRTHAKLWFAGKNQNWPLATYQVTKLKDLFTKIRTTQSGSSVASLVAMIDPSLDDMVSAVYSKNVLTFQESYKSMTSTCNSCHAATNFNFNVITIPDNPPVPDQDFKPQDQQ
ncbi:MAG TPA: hypothetical protein VL651_03195 [Bacteroidia bacterium]|jgi:hypothetical protein|nr:hypothetical protein [Bacteroidia bacterium]